MSRMLSEVGPARAWLIYPPGVYSGDHDRSRPRAAPHARRARGPRGPRGPWGSWRAWWSCRPRRPVPAAVLDHAAAGDPDGGAVADVRDDPRLRGTGRARRTMG